MRLEFQHVEIALPVLDVVQLELEDAWFEVDRDHAMPAQRGPGRENAVAGAEVEDEPRRVGQVREAPGPLEGAVACEGLRARLGLRTQTIREADETPAGGRHRANGERVSQRARFSTPPDRSPVRGGRAGSPCGGC